MRGRERIRTILVFALATTSSAALVGFGSGAAIGWAPDPAPLLVAVVVVASLLADLIHRRTGHLTPWRVDGQVPREWGRLFSPPVVALLYGARLGVGPLTMLPTWLWWAVTALAASTGAATGALVGAVFGIVRVGSILVVSLSGEGGRLGRGWVAELRSHDPYRLLAASCVVAVALTLSSCGDPQATPLPIGPTDPAGPTTILDEPPGSPATSTPPTDLIEGSPSSTAAMTTPEPNSPTTPAPPTNRLPPDPTPASPERLSSLLLESVPGFTAIGGPDADRWLDLGPASDRQPDATDELALLQTRGYAGGWTRVFRNDTQDVVMTTVYEFRSDTDAAYYLEDGIITVGGYGGHLFDVEGFPEARGFRQDTTDAAGPLVTYGLTFTEANRWYLVFVLGDPETVDVDIVVDAARRQLDRARQG